MKRTSADEGTLRFDNVEPWLDRIPAAAAVVAPDGTVAWWNREAGTLMGWTASSSPRLSDRGPWFERLRADAIQSGSGDVVITRRGRRRRMTLALRARPLADGSLLMLITDRTAAVRRSRSASEQRMRGLLRAAHERLRFIADVVPDHAIVSLDGVGCIISWNAAAERLTGYGAADVIGKPFSMLYAENGAGMAAVLKSVDEEGRHVHELDIRRHNGSLFRAHLTMAAVQEPGRASAGFAVIMRDLTERLRAADELRRSEDQLRHAQKMDAVGRLASGIAHDFNNVLTAIHGHIAFIIEDMPEQSGSREDALEVQRAAERATQLTRQLLTFARRQPSKPVPADINTVITGLEKLLRRLIRADIHLETSLQTVAPIFVDPGHLEQVIVNLVVNARDAIPKGGTIRVRTCPIQLSEVYSNRGLNLQPGDYVQLTVSDNGIGMSQDTQRQIFEPFYTTKPEGTGLGLSTVYGIVTQAGGHVFVYSEEGVGTTFKVFLPQHTGPAGQEPAQESRTETEARSGSVLLVEDDDAVRGLARRALQNGGFAVIEAKNGQEALDHARDGSNRIDVVVTDLMMPKMTGDELATQLAAMRPTIGIVVMSGFEEASLIREGRIRRRRHFLEKPFTPDALVRIVRNAMS